MIKFHKYSDRKGGYRWRVRAGNGEIIANGVESYTTAAMRDKGLRVLIKAIVGTMYEIVDDTRR